MLIRTFPRADLHHLFILVLYNKLKLWCERKSWTQTSDRLLPGESEQKHHTFERAGWDRTSENGITIDYEQGVHHCNERSGTMHAIKTKMKFWHTGLVLLLVIPVVLMVTRCAKEQTESTTSRVPTDSELVEAVKSRLRQAEGLPYAEEMQVQADSGVVELSGLSDNLLARDRATRIAESIRGVRAVVNNLTILSERLDEDVEADVKNALAMDPAAGDWSIGVSSEKGGVTLTGTVDTWKERKLAQLVVKSVDGVTGIKNNITVSYNLDRSDPEIAAEIKSTLKWDARIDANLIDVQMRDHSVILTGRVGSALEKRYAIEDGYVAGVSGVDGSGIKTQPGLREEMMPEIETPLPDDEIRAAIKRAFTLDPRVHLQDVEVEVVEGHVTLTGIVDNIKAKESAAQDAQNTLGVWSVENAIKIQPVQQLSNRRLKREIQQALLRNPYLDPTDITVAVHNGQVTLTGEAESYFQKWAVGDALAKLQPVTRITNNITVPHDQPVFERPFYGWDPINEDYAYLPVKKTDEGIAEDILRELSWSPFVNERDIQVTVKDGVATLTGTIHTWYQRNKATDLAYKGGAVDVKNELRYQFGPLLTPKT